MNDQENNKKPASGRERADKADFSLFNQFEEEGDYEEPDRDTDYTSIYREDGIEDEEFADTLFEEDDLPDPEEEDHWRSAAGGVEFDESGAVEADGSTPPPDFDQDDEPPMAMPQRGERPDDPETTQHGASLPEEDEDWDDDDEYYADDEPHAYEEQRSTLPWGLIAVAVIALALLMAGGYGVIQQRSETQEEIRRLRAALATSVTSEQVAETREALEETGRRNYQLQTTLDALNLENRRLNDTVAGLEAQLEAQRGALGQAPSAALAEVQPVAEPSAARPSAARPSAARPNAARPEPESPPSERTAPRAGPEAAAPAAAAALPAVRPGPVAEAAAPPAAPDRAGSTPEPAASQPVATAAAGPGWFVNFASYGVAATAQSWVSRLKPSSGRAIIATTNKDGRTFYRVRVVDLPSRESADRVAAELATEHRLPKLWVGRQE